MRVAIYLRVSTRKQESDNQLLQLQDYVSRQGWELDDAHLYVDKVTGSGKKTRKQFDACMLAAAQRKFDLILFWALDRFSREGVSKTFGYVEQLKAWSVDWRSYTQPFLRTGNQMTDEIVLATFAALAKQERLTISERTLAGLARARKDGRIGGRPRADINIGSVRARRAAGETLRDIAEDLGVSPAVLIKREKEVAHA
jgi:DNA invertase Pin-like site-specific DNA recombinase